MAAADGVMPQGPAEGFQILSQAPATHFITTNVAAPTELYVTADQFIRVLAQTFSLAPTVTLRYRLLRSADGVIVQDETVFTPTSNGVGSFKDVALAEGFLLSVWVQLVGATATRGNSYVTVQLFRGPSTAPTFLQTLVADSPNGAGSLGWPGGSLRATSEGPGFINVQTFAAPAAGAEINITVPNGQRWRLQSIRFSLTTSATVANRVPTIVYIQSGNEALRVPINGTIPASTSNFIVAMPGGGSPSSNNSIQLLPLPGPFFLVGGDQLNTVTTALQAGDQYSLQGVSIEQWLSS